MNTLSLPDRDKMFKVLNYLIILLIILLITVPMVYILAGSFMDPKILITEGLSFNPDHWTFEGYRRVLSDSKIYRGFLNSLFYSVGFGIMNVLLTTMTAYPLTHSNLLFKKYVYAFFFITMFFGGGLVPTYLLIRDLGLLDTPWALILPGSLSVGNLILTTVFMNNIPKDMIEAAKIDGANDIQIFFRIILPLSKPIMFVVFLYSFVGMWNSYFSAMIYIKSPELEPLQIILRRILIQNQPDMNMVGSQTIMAEMKQIAELLKYATIVISSAPLLIMYPFFQKYFEKGVAAGSVKG